MNRFTKELLGFAVLNLVAGVLFLTGIVNIDAVPGLYITFPVGIVALGAFIIFFAVEKETAMYDIEEWVHEVDLAQFNHTHTDASGYGFGHHTPLHT